MKKKWNLKNKKRSIWDGLLENIEQNRILFKDWVKNFEKKKLKKKWNNFREVYFCNQN